MMLRRHLLGFCLCLVSAWPLYGDDLTITFSVDPATASVLGSRAVYVYLRANKPDVVVSNFALLLNEELASVRPDLQQNPVKFENLTNSAQIEEIQLGENEKVDLLFHYPARSFLSPLLHWDLLTFEPGTQKVNFHFDFKPPVQGASVGKTEPVDFLVTAPPISVIVGGAVGACALALLILINRLRKSDSSIRWDAELWQVVIAIFTGGLVAGILIFLGDLLKDAHLGIQIAATSWKGGVIIGLFSYKLADILSQKLWEQPKRQKKTTPNNPND